MSKLLKATLLLLGAGCVLLLAGGLPWGGVPGVYRGGLMIILGLVALAFCLWGAWRLARGHIARLLCGELCLFLACAGVVAVWRFGCSAASFPGEVDVDMAVTAAIFGRVGLVCHALVGLLFAGIFGFLTLRLMTRRLWLAALHVWLAMLLLGANVDFCSELTLKMSAPVDASGEAYCAHGSDTEMMRIAVVGFDVLRYEDAATYSLLRHENGAWQPIGAPERQGNELVLGEERWPMDSLRSAPGILQRFALLKGEPPRMLLENPAPVKEYRATCRITLQKAEGDEVREEVLRVNDPIYCEGYWIYLMNYTQPARFDEPVVVDLEVRRAPGRWLALFAMLGIIMCSFGWAFGRREEVAA